jgi:hypothetical protein
MGHGGAEKAGSWLSKRPSYKDFVCLRRPVICKSGTNYQHLIK